MNIKENRPASFVAVALVYVLATLIGLYVYSKLNFHFAINLLIADVAATLVTFLFSLVFNNASVYDPYWSVAPIVIMVLLALKVPLTLARNLVLFSICLWGIRLTANWAYTFGNLTCQDWRYSHYKELTGFFYPVVNFFGIHLMPTLIVYLCILPAVFIMKVDAALTPVAFIGFAISTLAVILQGTADFQMHAYRKNRDGNFNRKGLWHYSRHPNYLGEILMWWGVALSGISAFPNRPWLLSGALVNTLLFVFISIPLAEGRQSKKEGFEEYKKETRMLLPLPKFRRTESN